MMNIWAEVLAIWKLFYLVKTSLRLEKELHWLIKQTNDECFCLCFLPTLQLSRYISWKVIDMPSDYFPLEPFLWKIQRGFIRNCCTFKASNIITILIIIIIIILIMIIITKLLRRCLPSSLLRTRRLHQRGVRMQTRLEGQRVQHQVLEWWLSSINWWL